MGGNESGELGLELELRELRSLSDSLEISTRTEAALTGWYDVCVCVLVGGLGEVEGLEACRPLSAWPLAS